MTVHVISVGLSLLDSLRDPRPSFPDDLASAILHVRPDLMLADAEVENDKDAASAWLAAALAAPGEAACSPRAAARLAELTAAVHPGRWPRRTSAEVDTFDRVPGTRLPLASSDIAVLVCSDTALGLLAGVWNAAVLTAGDLSRIRYLAAPADPPGPVRGHAMMVRVTGLDFGTEGGFSKAMAGLGGLGRKLSRSGDVKPGEPFRFYLSGGFKAAIPYLIGLAEGLRSLEAGRQVDAFVLHDTAGPGTPPIRLPLRRLIPQQVREELAHFDSSGVRHGVPGVALLNGYAYKISVNGKRCTLTAFGAGLRELFGVPAEGHGG